MKTQKKKPNIVSVHLSPEAKAALDHACTERGMTIKSLLGRLIDWFNSMNKTEQSIILGQVEESDVEALADLILRRRSRSRGGRTTRTRKRAAR